MEILYFGHACFVVKTKSGTVICCDPFDASVGYPVFDIAADAVTISHGHHDHNAIERVRPNKGGLDVFDEPREYQLPGVTIRGFSSYHDDVQGAKRGENIMFMIEADALKALHLGDLGHELDGDTLRAIGSVDVLMIPVGGYYTIDAAQAERVARSIAPGYIVPMHYRTKYSEELPIETEAPFLKLFGAEYIRLSAASGAEGAARQSFRRFKKNPQEFLPYMDRLIIDKPNDAGEPMIALLTAHDSGRSDI
ncbi:MAG: MBL fold metallo-hydrolase [Oscillospiraceae bacterium]|jgi:L-ascorbate metabolism protein UlaG (beta-lactamase superfamily)|nr:MBL fold metallo-hydrolase [Oscillospiraceae bacterium]